MKNYRIVAVTGCPAGIAHTFMAKEALETAAKKANVTIKVETYGQIGIENALTKEEIQNAEVVIIAADKDVDPERFAGKRVIEVSTSQAIKDSDSIVKDALEGKGTIYENKDDDISNIISTGDGKGFGHSIYKSLMSGVAHMLPFVVAGGVLIAISMLFGVHSSDPKSSEYNQFATIIKNTGVVSFGLMVSVLAGYIAESISKPALVTGFVGGMIAYTAGAGFLGGIVAGFIGGYVVLLLIRLLKPLPKVLNGVKAIFIIPVLGVLITGLIMYFVSSPMAAISLALEKFLTSFQNSNPILLGIIVGCMSAFDMGGPVNKAVSVTAIALVGEGNYFFGAGFSAACIAPPLITGVAVSVFGKYYTDNERNAGYVNYILGSTHITEGAIPFVVEDIPHNMPIMMLGSSIAAALTYFFRVQIAAPPAGGFLVLPIVIHPLLWLIAIFTGSIISGLLLGYVRKRKVENGNLIKV